jgi:hypothetical protein
MRTNLLRSLPLFACLALAPAAASQISQSTNFRLDAVSFDAGGGGGCSLNFASWDAIGDLAGAQGASVNYQAAEGFLEVGDPQPTNVPIVFGITPDFGPKAGGTAFTISGLNFDRLGTGPFVTVYIGGNIAPSLVLSNTQISGVAPAGLKGPRAVVVASPFGASFDPDGWVYTPAITTTPVVPLGGTLLIRNYGAIGNFYTTIASTATWVANTKFGTLLIGPDPFLQLLTNIPYPGPNGISDVPVVVPVAPVLHGLVVHFQSLFITNFSPVQGELTNASTTAIP